MKSGLPWRLRDGLPALKGQWALNVCPDSADGVRRISCLLFRTTGRHQVVGAPARSIAGTNEALPFLATCVRPLHTYILRV